MGWQMFSLIIFTSLCFGFVMSNLPPLTIEAISPRGIKIKMPDDGFSLFTMTASLRRGLHTTQWKITIPSAKNGYWTSVDRNIDLRLGDVVYCNIIAYKQNIQFQENKIWTVRELVPDSEYINCVISETRTPCSNQICKNTLIYSDEFNNDKLMWKKEVMFPQGPDYPFNAYETKAIRVENGTLIIKPEISIYARRENAEYSQWDLGSSCTGELGTRECIQTSSGAQILPPITSGKISTKGLFSFKFGRIDVRAKLPVGDWLIPEINLEPLNHEYGKDHYASGLLRIAYVKGNQEFSKELYGGPIVFDSEPLRSIFLTKHYSSVHWNNDFHVYSLIWKPDGFQLLVDDLPYGTFIKSTDLDEYLISELPPQSESWARGTPIAPLDQLFYISLGVRVGGINDFTDSPLKPWKNSNSKAMYKFWQSTLSWRPTWTSPELVVDYVRVYSL
ncbi:beta-1,3-glucan-binding protein 2-like [Vanessa atalanta]|uniref:beta-1,3-glucan-binding protein 2-like n=1 Tax=Vanessa atalanta TaxID=42275 RepID=UPI001FCDF818|nr:beta-1,3-glucan-binding protein 2-like [Vanessa atalanta]